jgi:hypothetical protein
LSAWVAERGMAVGRRVGTASDWYQTRYALVLPIPRVMTASDLRSGAAVAAEPQAVQACLSRILEGSDFPALS